MTAKTDEAMPLEITELNLPSDLFNALPMEDRVQLITSAALYNDILGFVKLQAHSRNFTRTGKSAKEDPVVDAQVSLYMLLLRMWTGRVHEGIKSLKQAIYPSSLFQESVRSMTDKASNARKIIKKATKSTSLIPHVRNKFAYHTDNDVIKEHLVWQEKHPEDLRLWLNRDPLNSLYKAGDTVTGVALMRATKKKTLSEAVNAYHDELYTVSAALLVLLNEYLGIMLHKFFPNIDPSKVHSIEVPSVRDISLHYFTRGDL